MRINKIMREQERLFYRASIFVKSGSMTRQNFNKIQKDLGVIYMLRVTLNNYQKLMNGL